MAKPVPKLDWIDPEDYLEGEKISADRHEYIDGGVYAMAGESKVHNIITGNLYMALRLSLRGSPCRVFMENVKTQVVAARGYRYYYPDIQVSCRVGQIEDDERFEAHPKLIIEVLSPSTERRDRAEKWHDYRQIATLEEYVLVAQDTRRVEIFRAVNQWQWELFTGTDTRQIELLSINRVIDMDVIYEDAVSGS